MERWRLLLVVSQVLGTRTGYFVGLLFASVAFVALLLVEAGVLETPTAVSALAFSELLEGFGSENPDAGVPLWHDMLGKRNYQCVGFVWGLHTAIRRWLAMALSIWRCFPQGWMPKTSSENWTGLER